MTKGGDIEKQIRELLSEHPDMPRTEMADLLGISRKTLYKHIGRIEAGGPVSHVSPKSEDAAKKETGGKTHKKEIHPHDGRRQNKGTPPPGPHSTGFKPGNTVGVTTGEHVNPFLRALLPAKDADMVEASRPANEVDALQRSIDLYAARLEIQLKRLRTLEEQKKRMVVFEASYTRQEGDAAIMGTGRISTRKRRSLDEEIRRQHAIIDRTQRLYDAAVRAKHDMLKAQAPGGVDPKVYMDALNAKAEEVWADEDLPENGGVSG